MFKITTLLIMSFTCLAVSACSGKHYASGDKVRNNRDQALGPGMFSGDKGEVVVYRSGKYRYEDVEPQAGGATYQQNKNYNQAVKKSTVNTGINDSNFPAPITKQPVGLYEE